MSLKKSFAHQQIAAITSTKWQHLKCSRIILTFQVFKKVFLERLVLPKLAVIMNNGETNFKKNIFAQIFWEFFIKKRLQHSFFPMNIAKFIRTPFL